MAEVSAISLTGADIDRCNRLRGQSIATCSCRLPNGGGWLECPPGARGILDAVYTMAAPIPTTRNQTPHLPATGAASAGQMAQQSGFTGNMCDHCHNFTMVRTGTCETCTSCGTAAGGCS